MKIKKVLLSFILYAGLLLAFAPKALAVTAPDFPACANPQGQLKVSYTDGTHGIPGDTSTHTGSDSVYTVSDTTLIQCFCPSDGNGIQTNWWNVSSLSSEDIQILISQGWTLIANGSAWGLDEAPYLTKNSSFSCSTSSSSSSSDSGTGGGETLGASTTTGQILGLATTGNAVFILSVISVGLLILTLGLILNKRKI